MSASRSLVVLQLRRERWLLPTWILGIVGLQVAVGAAIGREFSGEAERSAIAALAAANPAFLFLRGLPDGTSVGAIAFFQTYAFLAVLVGMMNTFLVTRHTRADEESGRSELIQSSPAPRIAELMTVLGIAGVADILVAGGILLAGVALGFGVIPSLLTGASLGALGLMFAGVAAVTAQLFPSSRGAGGAAAAIVGLAYVTRGVGDALGTATSTTHVEPTWISYLSPIGWGQATAPYSAANALPLVALVAGALLTSGLAAVICARRDYGSSVIPERRGSHAWRHPGAWALAVRLQLNTVLAWAAGVIVLGGLAGTLAGVVAAAVDSNDALTDFISNLIPGLHADTRSVFTIALLGMAGALATAAGITAVMRLQFEEAEGRAEELLTTRLTRTAWFGRQLLLAYASTASIAVAAALAAGTGLAIAGGGWDAFAEAFPTIAVHLPAGSIFIAVTGLAFAVVPRWTIAAGWVVYLAALVVGQLGDLIGLPSWAQDLSPLHHVPAYPLEDVTVAPMILPLAVSALVVGASLLALRRRDMTPG